MKSIATAAAMGICIAGTAISSTAQAQSNVTIYGILDTGLLYTNKTLNPVTGGNAGKQFSAADSGLTPSLFGLTGTEDLGGGLQAKFKLESGISLPTGHFSNSNGNMFGRQAWVSLVSKYGELKMGLQFSPLFDAIFATDPRSYSMFGSGLVLYGDNVAGTSIFNSNAVSYTTAEIAGLQASAMMALGGKAGDFQAGRQYGANAIYRHGPLTVDVAYYDGNAGGTVNTVTPTTVAFVGRTIGASYRFGALTASATVVNYKVAGSFNNYVYGSGVQYSVRPELAVDGGVYWTKDNNDSANHSVLVAAGAQYYLSKRTTLYGQVGFVNNHGRMNTGLALNGATFGVTGSTVGVNLGIRHMF
ncbi:porin [Burkholderia pyrrocinia]|uniref:porin n=1 Tax=Burkholderia pyrrocinia TaxID=60550 RepID=UPI0030D55B22